VVGGLVGLLGAVHLVCVEGPDLRQRRAAAGASPGAGRHRKPGGGSSSGTTSAASPSMPLFLPAPSRRLARALAQQAGETGRTRAALAFQMAGLGDVELTGRYRFRLKGERSPVKRSQEKPRGGPPPC
jgi:hypothetical protein